MGARAGAQAILSLNATRVLWVPAQVPALEPARVPVPVPVPVLALTLVLRPAPVGACRRSFWRGLRKLLDASR